MTMSWAEATEMVGSDYDGMSYIEREDWKTQARERYRETTTTEERLAAIWMEVIEAHYDRSRESYQGKHPDLTTFARHWLAARGGGGWAWASPDDITALCAQYPLRGKPRIPPGKSYWHTPKQYQQALRNPYT